GSVEAVEARHYPPEEVAVELMVGIENRDPVAAQAVFDAGGARSIGDAEGAGLRRAGNDLPVVGHHHQRPAPQVGAEYPFTAGVKIVAIDQRKHRCLLTELVTTPSITAPLAPSRAMGGWSRLAHSRRWRWRSVIAQISSPRNAATTMSPCRGRRARSTSRMSPARIPAAPMASPATLYCKVATAPRPSRASRSMLLSVAGPAPRRGAKGCLVGRGNPARGWVARIGYLLILYGCTALWSGQGTSARADRSQGQVPG